MCAPARRSVPSKVTFGTRTRPWLQHRVVQRPTTSNRHRKEPNPKQLPGSTTGSRSLGGRSRSGLVIRPRADYSSASYQSPVSETPAAKPAANRQSRPSRKTSRLRIHRQSVLPAVRKGIVDRGITPSGLDLRQWPRVRCRRQLLDGDTANCPVVVASGCVSPRTSIAADKTIALADQGSDARPCWSRF